MHSAPYRGTANLINRHRLTAAKELLTKDSAFHSAEIAGPIISVLSPLPPPSSPSSSPAAAVAQPALAFPLPHNSTSTISAPDPVFFTLFPHYSDHASNPMRKNHVLPASSSPTGQREDSPSPRSSRDLLLLPSTSTSSSCASCSPPGHNHHHRHHHSRNRAQMPSSGNTSQIKTADVQHVVAEGDMDMSHLSAERTRNTSLSPNDRNVLELNSSWKELAKRDLKMSFHRDT